MIVLITPTGARLEQIVLCTKLMKKQTYTGKVAWIIVDDAEPRTTDFIKDDFREGWKIIKVYPKPVWEDGQNTQGRNLKAGIDVMKGMFSKKEVEAIYMIEDDDYYKPQYLEAMRFYIEGYNLAGETCTMYYNIRDRRWVLNENKEWSSLFQTVMTWDALPVFETLYGEKYIDYVLFRMVDTPHLFSAGMLAVGMKGMAGRTGIGVGHKFIGRAIPDPTGDKLRELIGNDANLYL